MRTFKNHLMELLDSVNFVITEYKLKNKFIYDNFSPEDYNKYCHEQDKLVSMADEIKKMCRT